MSAHENEKDVGDLTPLIDIAFLILIFFMCLPFRTLDGKLQAHLPLAKGPDISLDRPPEELKLSVHIVGRDEQLRSWGPELKVPAPTRAVYRYGGGTESEDLKDVLEFIRRGKRAATPQNSLVVRGEIKAGPRVPHKYVIAVLNRFAEAGVMDVDYYGTQIPGRNALLARRLPYPRVR